MQGFDRIRPFRGPRATFDVALMHVVHAMQEIGRRMHGSAGIYPFAPPVKFHVARCSDGTR